VELSSLYKTELIPSSPSQQAWLPLQRNVNVLYDWKVLKGSSKETVDGEDARSNLASHTGFGSDACN